MVVVGGGGGEVFEPCQSYIQESPPSLFACDVGHSNNNERDQRERT